MVLFFFVVFPGNHTPACFATYVSALTGKHFTETVAAELFRPLVVNQILEKGTASRGTFGAAYRLDVTFSRKALELLASEAKKSGWWPTESVLAQGLAGEWLGVELASAVRNYVDVRQVWQVAETLKALLVGGTCAIACVPKGARYPLASVHWTAVAHLLRVLAPGEDLPVDDLPGPGALPLLSVLFEFGFLMGRDVRPVLAQARKTFAAARPAPPAFSLCAFCALAVWTGQREVLNSAATLVAPGSPAERFAALCLDIFEGRFEMAEKAFAGGADSFRGVFPTDVSTPVWTLGMTLALHESAPLGRVSKYAKQLEAKLADPINWHPVGRAFWQEVETCRRQLVERVMTAGAPEWKPKLVVAEEDPLRSAREVFLAGYPTLASLYLAAVRRSQVNLPEVAKFESMLNTTGTPTLVKTISAEPKWKSALKAIEEALPERSTAARGEQVLNGTIGWSLGLVPFGEGNETRYACSNLVPLYRGPRGRENGQDDRVLTLNALASSKYRACLTSCDTEVLQILLKSGYNPRVPHTVPNEALELLCGQPRVSQAVAEGAAHQPIKLARSLCEVTTAKLSAGGLMLTVPAWLLSARSDAYVLRKDGEDAFTYYSLTKRLREVLTVFQDQPAKGILVVPPEGEALAKKVLVRLASEMTVGGDVVLDTEGALTKVVGDTTPHVRLVYANETLSISLVVEPIANRSVAVYEPGIGRPQRLIQLRGGRTVLLVRDLAAEETAAAAVRVTLESFDAWARAKNRWLISDAEASLEALRTLKALGGIKLEGPEGEKVRVTTPKAGGVQIEASGEDWFEVGGDVTLDDGRVVKLVELLRALANREGNFVRFGENDFLYLSNELLRRLDALAVATDVKASNDDACAGLSAAALPMLAKAFDDAGEGMDDLPALPTSVASRIEKIQQAFAATVEIPRYFKGELRSYQETGYRWLARLAACGFGACLADDMGLGKTVQIVALLLARQAEGASLVVAPASVCPNWARELVRFAPTLNVVMSGELKDLPELCAGDVVIASYGLLVSREEAFKNVAWNGVVLDEAQAVKNAETQRARIACRLSSKFRVAATGTPVENRLAEFASIFSFLNPGLLGTAKDFEKRFVEAGFATSSLKRLVEPFVLRRLKRDVLRELPEKTEVTLRVKLGDEERAQYEACRVDALASLKEKGEETNRISVLAALMRLRRFCCHPSLVFPESAMGAKLEAVMELLGDLREGGHRALVFSQFVDFLAIVREAIADRAWTYRYLDGSTPTAERFASVDAFQRGDGDFFLISLKAGGTGLNLTAANYVVLLDPWWNPAVEDQAADRAHRIGQRLPVTVYRVVAEDTVEDRILDLHESKRAVSADLLENAKGESLTVEQLMGLFK